MSALHAIDRPVSRRQAIVGLGAAAGVLTLGFPLQGVAAGAFAPNAFIRIDATGRATFILPYVEMGQGAYTSQVQILAEELDLDIDQVAFEPAPPDLSRYAHPALGDQITGGSAGLRGAWATLRPAGAAARAMLVQAAAQRWDVAPDGCETRGGSVTHRPTGRRLGYGELTADAARLPVPGKPELKARAAYRVLGKPTRRVDTAAKTDGSALFGIDARPPGLRYAMVQTSPVLGGMLKNVGDAKALKVSGVRQVVSIGNAVAVVADTTWAAKKGLAALEIEWDDGANASLATADMVAGADAALEKTGLVASKAGDVVAAEKGAAAIHEMTFRLPMMAHAAMEPLNCTAHVTADRCDVWVGCQSLARAKAIAAEVSGLPADRVTVHNHLLGGGFGRRLEIDYVAQAVRIGKQVDGPVKVVWSREEDTRQDYYRFHNHSRVTVALDAAGAPTSWRHRIVGPNIMARFLPVFQKDGVDLDIVGGANGPYDFANLLTEFVRNEAPAGLNTGNWRGVGATRNVFIVESVIDALARRAGKDPIAYRRTLLKSQPRMRAALDLVADKSGWGTPMPPRTGRGVALCADFASYVAMVAEAHVSEAGEVTVKRIVATVDTGFAINPDIVKAQIEGGAIFGVSSALFDHVTVENGRVQQGNFDTNRVLRMNEAPPVEVHIIESGEDPGGVGEPGTAAAIAAVANAVSAVLGRQVAALPLDAKRLKEA